MSYKDQAESFLESLMEILMDCVELEVDETSEGLSILTNAGQYLLNYHNVTAQLWLSSPVSGAHHFHYQGAAWLCTRTNESLTVLLQQELKSFGCSLKD